MPETSAELISLSSAVSLLHPELGQVCSVWFWISDASDSFYNEMLSVAEEAIPRFDSREDNLTNNEECALEIKTKKN